MSGIEWLGIRDLFHGRYQSPQIPWQVIPLFTKIGYFQLYCVRFFCIFRHWYSTCVFLSNEP